MNQCKRIFLYYYSCLKVGLPVVADERKKWFVQQCIVELLGLFADHSLLACLSRTAMFKLGLVTLGVVLKITFFLLHFM